MANEASKTKRIWTDAERALLSGKGIDIGCGPDPIFPDVRRFDVEHGDANVITRHVTEQFDFVFSSHCLEHMHDPRKALLEWWQLVRPGGILFFLVPEEDLYEQGVFPSRYNPDHKATFTISKRRSWSSASYNILDLAAGLPGGELVSVQLHDLNYDRRLSRFGQRLPPARWEQALTYLYCGTRNRTGWRSERWERWFRRRDPVDQTLRPDVLAQIQTIVRKRITSTPEKA